ncbi:chitinase [Paxillus involutus ATCC 200175]|uniref:Chitinase n=1 Tax=Paxillus involutus ATCC 200175 TaxID=664439 RepID=A0A0C9SP85_PAXIN|nr:chitinase [Paxillus involutus ATCC 200175]
MDIEGGSQTGYSAFLTALRTLMNGGDKQYYITAAPQCPYPDAYIGTTLNEVEFDAVYVQFYDNYCGLTSFSNPDDWDYSQWDTWATTVSPNPNVKVYIGAPGSSAAASSGYVNASTMATIIQQTRSSYSSFGGVMLWDASAAYANGRYDMAVKAVLTGSTGGTTTTTASTSTTTTSYTSTTTPHTTNTTSHTSTTTSHKSKTTSHTSTTTSPTTTKATTTTTTTAPATTTTPSTGSCAGVVPWQPHLAYVGGDEVTYGGDLWTAKWWSEADVPGGVAGDWINDGACT